MKESMTRLFVLLLALSEAKKLLVQTKGERHKSRKSYLVETRENKNVKYTSDNDYTLDVPEVQEEHGLGCPMTLECEKGNGGMCIIQTPYNTNYLIQSGMEYESGRIKCTCSVKMVEDTTKKMCGIYITNLQEKDIGNWRCGNPYKSLKTLVVLRPKKENQCSNKPLNDTSSENICARLRCMANACENDPEEICCKCSKTGSCWDHVGNWYDSGSTWEQDCNTCTCLSGSIACTEKACLEDDSSETQADDSKAMSNSKSGTNTDDENNNLSGVESNYKNQTLESIEEEIQSLFSQDEYAEDIEIKDHEDETSDNMVEMTAMGKQEQLNSRADAEQKSDTSEKDPGNEVEEEKLTSFPKRSKMKTSIDII